MERDLASACKNGIGEKSGVEGVLERLVAKARGLEGTEVLPRGPGNMVWTLLELPFPLVRMGVVGNVTMVVVG